MKATIVIPTYWRGPESEAPLCELESEYQYDHATPLESEGTLGRALASLSILKSDEEFSVAVVAVPTRRELNQAVQLKVGAAIARFEYDFPMFLIGPDELAVWRQRITEAGYSRFNRFLSLDGYSNIRNMCLLAAILTGAEVAVLFDDDQVYEDPAYLEKALEFIGSEHEGQFVGGVTGFYRQDDDSFLLPPAESEWQRLWGSVDSLNEASSIIGEPPRLKKTPFAFGGNMVIHRQLFEKIPFDLRIPRGVDTDYLINASFFGYDFFLDRELWIKHLPPQPCAPPWYQLRKDIMRFSMERAKIRFQHANGNLRHLAVEELDPFPGRFLKEDLHDLVMQASLQMATDYLEAGLEDDASECISNIAISRAGAEKNGNLFDEYLELQKRWREFISVLPGLSIWHPARGVD